MLQAFGNGCVADKTILAEVSRRESPQDRTIVNIEHHLPASGLDAAGGAHARRKHGGGG
jgi:hypothetical protein